MRTSRGLRAVALATGISIAVLGGGVSHILAQVPCGPFVDVSGNLCPSVLEIFYMGITTGTSATTYSPDNTVTRGQMARFLTRTVDQLLARGSRRAALDQWWTTQGAANLGLTTVGSSPLFVKSDGADLWVTNLSSNSVSRVRGSDGKLLETWTGATNAVGVLVAMGRIFVTGNTSPGNLYRIDPSQPAGAVTIVASNLGNTPYAIAFDGSRIWTANLNGGSVSIVTPGASLPWSVTTVSTGSSGPVGILYDGANIWVTDNSAGTLLKLDSNGAILQTVTVGPNPDFPIFDGTNIWVPNNLSSSVSVVRASSGAVLATLTGNGLNQPVAAAFDGQRVLLTNSGNSVSLWRAADLTPIGSFATGGSTQPYGACSDGINFWIALQTANQLARF